MIDRATVQKIKDTADIVEVVGDYVHLVRRGANYMGLCPFHNERTPSFSVNKARNFCYCFSCHKGGSPVNFIMEKEGISYHDALLQLAKKYGIKVEEKELSDEEREAMGRREGMYLANDWAMQWFEENLRKTEDGRNIGLQYLYSRGVTEEAIKAFHLGYATDSPTAMVEAARKKGFNLDVLKSLGLIGVSQQGREYDRFRGRVIFPVLNSSGKVIAFGGRDLKGGPAKYINSPESELYKKSNELYGMYQARAAIVREDRCYLVEGYLDVIGMWQSGLKNVVASSGTALTDGQIALIHRFTKNVTLIYDGDAAGIKAALRGIDMLISHQLDVNVLLLPDGDDPDSFARKHTPEEFREYVKSHETDILRFKAQVLMKEVQNNPQRRIDAVRSMVTSLAHISEKYKLDVYIQECSAIMGVSEESIRVATARERAVIVEQLKKQRRLKELNRDIESERIAPQFPVQDEPTSPKPQAAVVSDSPLKPFEWDVLVYCIKYGYLDFCASMSEDDKVATICVLEYIDEEISADDISFSVESYGRIFRTLKTHLPDFRKDLEDYIISIQPRLEEERKKGIQEIGNVASSINEIQKAEKALEERIANISDRLILDYTREYPSRLLASHEDDTVRRITTEAITERHQLSSIFERDHPAEREEDKLVTFIPTALSVWKNGILDIQLTDLMAELRKLNGTGDKEKETMLQARLVELIRLRSEVAKNIGDRILTPPRGFSRSNRLTK